jgi:hypothetical protein
MTPRSQRCATRMGRRGRPGWHVYIVAVLRKFQDNFHIQQIVLGTVPDRIAAVFEVQRCFGLVGPFTVVLEIREGKRILDKNFHSRLLVCLPVPSSRRSGGGIGWQERPRRFARREPHVGEHAIYPQNNNRVFAYWIFGRQGFTPLLVFARLLRLNPMQARDPLFSPFRLADHDSIKIVIAYDSIETAQRAEAVYERLAKRLGANFDFEQRLWRFDVLEEETFRAEAARDAANADILIVATREDTKLPCGVEDWLESSLQQHRGTAALVALLEHPSAPVQPYLEDIARRGGMDFFAQSQCDSAEEQHPEHSTLHLPANGHPRWPTNN